MRYIAYYRVSTQKQGRSGLGLEDQPHLVQRFLRDNDQLVQEFTEVESGRKKERPQLQAAIQTAKQHGARLLIAKLNQLSRSASFVMVLRDSEVDLVACDVPDANTLTIGIMASFTRHSGQQSVWLSLFNRTAGTPERDRVLFSVSGLVNNTHDQWLYTLLLIFK